MHSIQIIDSDFAQMFFGRENKKQLRRERQIEVVARREQLHLSKTVSLYDYICKLCIRETFLAPKSL